MQAMILAAGFGTRLRPLSERRPKPLFPIFDTPLLLLQVEQLLQSGFDKILVNCHYLAEQIMAALSAFPEVTVLKEEKILGTGGALRQALPLLDDDPLLVINSDIMQNFDLAALFKAHGVAGPPVSMVTHRYDRFASLEVDAAGKVLSIGSKEKKHQQPKLAFTGVHIVAPTVIERIPPNLFYGIIDLYRKFIAEGCFPQSLYIEGRYWRDIGTVEDYLGVHADIIAQPFLFPAFGHVLDASGYISPTARLDDSVETRDWVVVGSGAVIGEGAVLQRCVVWDNARVLAGSTWRDRVLI